MPNEEILNYIKQSLEVGDSRENIKNKLMFNGWQEKDIEEAFSIIPNPSAKLFPSLSSTQDIASFIPEERKTNKTIYAVGFGTRLIATLIDGVILFVITLLFGMMVANPGQSALDVGESFAYIIVIPYTIGMWFLAGGATIGKKIMRIKIVTVDGRPIGIGRAMLRYIGYFISGLLFGLGYLWIIWDEKQQGLHDKIAGTIVIKS